MLSIFKSKPGGIIRNLGLTDFYETLSDSEREELKDALGHPYQLTSGKPYTRNDLTKGNRTFNGGIYRFCMSMAGTGGKSSLSYKLYLKAYTQASNAEDIFFAARELAEYHYRLGENDECERYCRQCIAEFSKFYKKKMYIGMSTGVFKRLAIMYEKQGRIQDAIDVSELALSYGQKDGTKGGFEGRIEKLKRKAKVNLIKED